MTSPDRTSLYSREHHALQARFGTEKLADMLDTNWVHAELADEDRAFIESRDMLFLSTVNPDGCPTVSYKGGPTGFVKVLDATTLAFPGYDGNGMFLSMGNIRGQGKVGLLFIDFETPNRLRVQGVASVVLDDPLMADFAEAQYVVRVEITKAWVNCPRYIHRYSKRDQSRYVPQVDRATPLAAWKRLEMVQDVLPPADRAKARAEGLMPIEDYQARVARGES